MAAPWLLRCLRLEEQTLLLVLLLHDDDDDLALGIDLVAGLQLVDCLLDPVEEAAAALAEPLDLLLGPAPEVHDCDGALLRRWRPCRGLGWCLDGAHELLLSSSV